MRVDQAVAKLRNVSTQLSCPVADNPSQIDVDQISGYEGRVLVSDVQMLKDPCGPVEKVCLFYSHCDPLVKFLPREYGRLLLFSP
jgi:hypothetical protein